MRVVLVSATRSSQTDFIEKTWLGHSITRLSSDFRIHSYISFENRFGLPQVYNTGLGKCESNDIIVFLHDDVRIDDYFLSDRLIEAVQRFDVVGVVGNRRRRPMQPNWGFLDTDGTWDDRSNLSGRIAHGESGRVTLFGESPAACELLDGLFLAARVDVIRAAGLSFDSKFAFHFYDMDFCRSAQAAGLRLGTWPLSLTHKSSGKFDSNWRDAFGKYIEKWGS